MRLHVIAAAVAGGALGCSATKPDAVYPPNVGVLPVKPMPEDDLFGDDTEEASEPAKPKGPAPIDPALPAAPPTELSQMASCAEKACMLEGWMPDHKFAKTADGRGSPAGFWMHEIKTGSTVAVPRHSHLTTLGVVLAGSVLVKAEEGRAAQKLDTWGAFRAPGAGVTVKAEGADAKVLFALTTTKDTLDESLDAGKKQAWAVRWRKRPGTGALVTAKFDEVEPWSWAGGAVHVRVAFGGDAAQTGSFAVMTAGADLGVPPHQHDTSWEHLAVLSGASIPMKLAGETIEPKAGDVVAIPKATQHSVERFRAPVMVVQVFTPSGPEQRYEKLWKDPKMGGTAAPTEVADEPPKAPEPGKPAAGKTPQPASGK